MNVNCSIQATHSFLICFSPKGLVLLLPLLPPVLRSSFPVVKGAEWVYSTFGSKE